MSQFFKRFPFKLQTALTLLLLAGALTACGPDKKDAKKELTTEEYDYRAALQNYKIGINHLGNKEYIRAIEHLKLAIEGDANNWRYHHGLGMAYSLHGQLGEAEKSLNQALVINPNSSETHNLLGSIYVDLKKYEEAVGHFKKVIMDKSYPQPEFPYFNLGLCRIQQGRDEEAIAAFGRVIQIAPEFYRAYVAIGDIYRDRNEYQKALFYYQKAETGFNDNVTILFEIGRAMFKLKQFDKAKSYLAQVSILFPPPNIDKPTQDMLRYIEKYQREARN